jgi:hypothetical protein
LREPLCDHLGRPLDLREQRRVRVDESEHEGPRPRAARRRAMSDRLRHEIILDDPYPAAKARVEYARCDVEAGIEGADPCDARSEFANQGFRTSKQSDRLSGWRLAGVLRGSRTMTGGTQRGF